MPGALLIQKCAYLFQLNSTLKYFSITGGSIDADEHNSTPEPAGLFQTASVVIAYVTDLEFKGTMSTGYFGAVEGLHCQRVWGNGQIL